MSRMKTGVLVSSLAWFSTDFNHSFVSKRWRNDLVYRNLYKFSSTKGTQSGFVCVFHHNIYICPSQVSGIFYKEFC